MKSRTLLPLLASLAPLAAAQERALVLRGGQLFDGLGDERVANRGILIRGGKFLEVDVELPEEALAGADVIELADDETLLPGLFDLHAHHGIDLFGRGRRDETTSYPAIFLANGVTSVFPAGEVDPDRMRELQQRLARGEQVGPRLLRSGPYFGGARRGWDRRMDSAALRAEVDRLAAEGVIGLKAKRISPEHLRVLIDRAHQHGLTVTGHLDSGFRNSVNPRDAIAMGIDRVEHFLGGDAFPADRPAYASLVEFEPGSPEFDAICRLYIERGVYFDATLSAYGYFAERDPEVFTPWVDERAFFTPFVQELLAERPPRPPIEQFERIYWAKRATLKGFFDAGGGHLITVGTDHPSWGDYLSGFGVHRELHCMVLAGLPPAAALRAATQNPARALGVGERLGSVEPGKLADCVVVRGNPLEDIRATRDVRLVVLAGRVHDAAALLEAARGTLGPASEEELGDW